MSNKNCGHTVPCGCGDTPLTTGAPCGDGSECEGNPCAENFSTDCIIYTGDNLPQVGITTGMNLTQILQQLDPWHNQPGCVSDPLATCISPPFIQSTSITDTTITIGWTIPYTATSFEVEYSDDLGVTWTPSGALLATDNTYTISALTANSTYFIKVNGICAVGNCYSAVISVTTLNTI